jgi:hypothetical protein
MYHTVPIRKVKKLIAPHRARGGVVLPVLVAATVVSDAVTGLLPEVTRVELDVVKVVTTTVG